MELIFTSAGAMRLQTLVFVSTRNMYYVIFLYYNIAIVTVVGRLRNTRTDSIPETSSRPFINISIRMSGCTINLYRLTPFIHIILTAMCDRAPLSIYVGFPPNVCTLQAQRYMGACATSDTDNNTLYTINTPHDKRAPHATAT